MHALSTSRMVCFALIAALILMIPAPAAAASCTGTGIYSISGTVKRSSGVGVSGVTMNLSGPGGCTSSTKTGGTRGFYLLSNLRNGTYTVTPSKTGCGFTPPSRVVTVKGANISANFQASCL